MTSSPSAVAEIVTFRITDDVSPDAFTEAAAETRAFVEAAPGFLARTLTQGEDGTWTDYVLWASMDDAKAAAATIGSHPSTQTFIKAIAPGSVDMRHEHVRWQMV
ncbi:antibiotic biosynthesis monooxygenase family protein [Aestuariibius sp. 2305UL40-4]|uniref:antibiotic biosynthesis monooxygenase family protein n=1 Tax=Aestuariibius violaceus TaxID=3234132 RepID=UPI00345EDBD7